MIRINTDRASDASHALDEYMRRTGGDRRDRQTAAVDMVADLMHHLQAIGEDAQGTLDMAARHFNSEATTTA